VKVLIKTNTLDGRQETVNVDTIASRRLLLLTHYYRNA